MDLQDKNTNESTGMLNKLDDRIDNAVALYERKTAEYERGKSLDDEPSRQDVEEAKRCSSDGIKRGFALL